ncbi:hypothetical protein GCM10017044_13090 [Kordiimonas sediminis]|uniref:COQ9 C-terminal domain-containing protein n=1 Tax=Kordiimonas sediminis TaxID=1735581 RepID=A0A919E4W9_9PROT|nr:COQ9 family protein [Kordiimonas sediminis]GHF19712.1 hypothetical protein GCM10017044_13090 [Kordiimonas sediminis]
MAAQKHTETSDIPVDNYREPLMHAMLDHVPFDGWSAKAMAAAASDVGITAPMAELAFPKGPIEVLEYHLQDADVRLATALAALDLPSMKIRDRITVAVKTRIEQAKNHKEAVRRGLAVLSMPQHAMLGTKALWATCDVIWRAAGDTSTDYNWYTKRMTLSAVYSTTLLYWMDDDSDDLAATWDFLDRRIENVMQFEKAKFELRKSCQDLPSISRFLNRIRYPAP